MLFMLKYITNLISNLLEIIVLDKSMAVRMCKHDLNTFPLELALVKYIKTARRNIKIELINIYLIIHRFIPYLSLYIK